MKNATVLALVLLGASAVFALLALYTLYDSSLGSVCQVWMMSYSQCNAFWVFQSYFEITEGFAVAAVLSLLFALKRFSFSWLDRPLVPRFSKRPLAALVLIGASTFVFFALMSATYHTWQFSRSFSHFFMFHTIQAQGSSVGVVALGLWSLTVLCLTFRKGFIGALRIFGLPAIVFLGVALLYFFRGQMTDHATNFTTWSLGGIYILSNWTVFVASASLEAALLLESRRRP
jgi:hypothetical protein